MVLVDIPRETVELLLALAFGASALPLYTLCVAQANDRAPSSSFVEVSGDLLMMFGVGAIFGPYAAALLMTAVGHAGVFIFTGGVHLGLAGFTILEMRRRSPVPVTDKTPFVTLPKTPQAVSPLDSRPDTREGGRSSEEGENDQRP